MVQENASVEIISSDFIAGAPSVSALPLVDFPEIALVGRSNAGKSTLLNRLTTRNKLARTGRTPGQTRAVNLFDVRYRMEEGQGQVVLADLPGFGYAKRSKYERVNFERLITNYFATRETLQMVCLLNDSRRAPEEEELAVRDLAFANGLIVLVLLTKVDRLSQKERHEGIVKISEGYSLERDDLVLTGSNIPVEKLWRRILEPLEPIERP